MSQSATGPTPDNLNEHADACCTDATTIRCLRASDDTAVGRLHGHVFGPGRFARAAFRIRERAGISAATSFVAETAPGLLVGAVLMAPVHIGEACGFWLGPIAVMPEAQAQGVGRSLMVAALDAAAVHNAQFVGLVGDPPFYQPFGFAPANVRLPGPAEPGRILFAWLGDRPPIAGALEPGEA
ncbi:MAG: N-acetyltransferase [Pseudomonadota bacterium]